MAATSTEGYRTHAVWGAIAEKLKSLRAETYSNAGIDIQRRRCIAVLLLAQRSKANPQPYVYDSILNDVHSHLQQLTSTDENSFHGWAQNYLPPLETSVRALPGPAHKDIPDAVLHTLDDSIAARDTELKRLSELAQQRADDLATQEKTIGQLTKQVADLKAQVATESGRIGEVVDSANERLTGEWENKLNAWENTREKKDAALDREMASHVQLLAAAARVGDKLVEHAAGDLTARKWTERATRERRSANWLRLVGFTAYLAAAVLGGFLIWQTAISNHELSVGAGLLRGLVAASLVGLGSLLMLEARRHFREADTAEEVSLAMNALESFYANSEDDDRRTARTELGDAVFVRNVLSRFSSRDTAKHGGITNQELTEVIDLIGKGSDTAKKLS